MRVAVRARPRDGRFRAGLRFTREARIVDVTDEQLAALEADPKLVVEPVEDSAPVSPEPPLPPRREPPNDASIKPTPGKAKR